MSAAELAIIGGAAGVGAIVGALLSGTHVSLVRHASPRPAPSTVVVIRPSERLLPSGEAPAAGGRVLRVVRPPYDWARDELGV